jgi:NAD(P)-dependent dehydrogenase (short-subunit alcohol dehydrogenase family)
MITGAGRGLGRSFARTALEAGDDVIATARSADALAGLVAEYGSRVTPVVVDITDEAAVKAAVDDAVGRRGRIDVLVNNAGYGLTGAVEEVLESDIRDQFAVNFYGVLWCTRAVLPHMRDVGGGHIFQISSVGGVIALPNTSMYHASKWAVEGMSESLALEVAQFGIKVTIVEPGPFRSDWNGTSLRRSPRMTQYDRVLASRRDALSGEFAFTQPGDPRLAGQALLTVLESDDPPLRLLLGGNAADLAPRTYQRRLDEWARWDDLARSADFG